jgi:hypothetical protein
MDRLMPGFTNAFDKGMAEADVANDVIKVEV